MLVRDADRRAARGLVQPAVPQRRLPPAPAGHPVRQARADVARPAAAEPAIRDPARREPRRGKRRPPTRRATRPVDDDAAHRTHRPVYEKTGHLTTKMQRTLVHHALAQLPACCRSAAPGRPRAAALIDRAMALPTCTFRPAGAAVDELNAFRSPAQRRLIFEEFFLFQLGLVLRKRRADAERKPRSVVVTDEIREAARARAAVQADRRSEEGHRRDRRGHAAAAADEPAAAGRRRLGQDDRRADGRARRDGERLPGGVHGADRDPGRAALHHHPPAARALALPHRAADRARRAAKKRREMQAELAGGSITSSSARTRWSRSRSRSASSAWRSSTSSTASACCSARRCAPRACTPTSS